MSDYCPACGVNTANMRAEVKRLREALEVAQDCGAEGLRTLLEQTIETLDGYGHHAAAEQARAALAGEEDAQSI